MEKKDRETAKSVLPKHGDSSIKLHGVISRKNHNLDTHCQKKNQCDTDIGHVFERRGLKQREHDMPAFILRGHSIAFTATDTEKFLTLR
jgi:hypothetical protein